MLAAITSGLDLNVATTGPTYLNTGPTPAADMLQNKDLVTKDDKLGRFGFTNRYEQLIYKNTKRHRRSPYQYLCSHGQGQILTIFQNGSVVGTPIKTTYSEYARIIFELVVFNSMLLSTFVPTKPSNGAKIPSTNCNSTILPLYKLKGVKSKSYVCMNRKGNLYSSQDPPDPSECWFMRELFKDRYVMFKSCKYPEDRSTDYLIALRKDGKAYSGSNQRLTNRTSVHEAAWFLECTDKIKREEEPIITIFKNQQSKTIQPTATSHSKKLKKSCRDKIRHSKKCKKSRTKKCKRMERKCNRRRKNRNKNRDRGNKRKNRKNKKNRRRQKRTSTTTATVTRS